MRRPEAMLQRACIAYLALHYGYEGPVAWSAVNAAPVKGKIAGAIAKSLGQRAGMPDLLLFHAGRAYGVELKSAKGQLSPDQEWFHAILDRAGVPTAIVRDLEGLQGCLAAWGLSPLRGSTISGGSTPAT